MNNMNKNNKVTKAVFPVAGLGTRFLPATKASPKEMLPIVDKPLIQYAVEEAIEAGIEVMVFVTGRSKRAIPDHFDTAPLLEAELQEKGKDALLRSIKDIIPSHVSCVYIRQAQALGLGHAVQCALPVIGSEPFAVMLADDLIVNQGKGCLKQMVDLYQEEKTSILGVESIAPEDTQSYGIVDAKQLGKNYSNVLSIVEKPKPEDAPSNLGVVGRYILNPRIFDELAKLDGSSGVGGEIQLTDAIASLLTKEQVLAYQFDGKRYDCGSKLGYLIATVEQGLAHVEVGAEFTEYLKNLAID
jgi:UTP--glucose-1-phosphate uridylyltransferase